MIRACAAWSISGWPFSIASIRRDPWRLHRERASARTRRARVRCALVRTRLECWPNERRTRDGAERSRAGASEAAITPPDRDGESGTLASVSVTGRAGACQSWQLRALGNGPRSMGRAVPVSCKHSTPKPIGATKPTPPPAPPARVHPVARVEIGGDYRPDLLERVAMGMGEVHAPLVAPQPPKGPPSRWVRDGAPYTWDVRTDNAEADRRTAEDLGEIPMRLWRKLLALWLARPQRRET